MCVGNLLYYFTWNVFYSIDYDLPPPPSSPTRAELTNSIRHSRLVTRFNDLYSVDRLDMQVVRQYLEAER